MRVVRVHRHGPPEVLVVEEVPEPVAADGEVLVDVAVAGVMFADTMARSGAQAPPGLRLPYVPGNEVGGTVAVVGAGVDPALIGRRVVARLRGTGGYAERAVVAADELLAVPDALPTEAAVALLANGRTALGVVREAGIRDGDRVLVEAAAGGVGSLLVQLVREAGASMVVGAAGGPSKLRLVRRLGADVVVDYTDPGWTELVRDATGGDGVDVVLDGLGGEVGRAAFELLAGAGRMVVFGYASGTPVDVSAAEVMRRGVTVVGYGPPRVTRRPGEMRALSEQALSLAADGRLVATVGQTYRLEQAAAAHRAVESRATTGKTVLFTR